MRAVAGFLFIAALSAAATLGPNVEVMRLPVGGLQPQIAADGRGGLHMVYLTGDPGTADVVYSKWSGAGVSPAMSGNAQKGSAIAEGTIRRVQPSIGKNDRGHEGWN